MHDASANFNGFAQKRPSRVSRLLDFRGGTVVGSRADSFVNLQGSWATTGSPTAVKLNVVDNGSSSVFSPLLDLQVGGVSRFTCYRGAGISVASNIVVSSGSVLLSPVGGYLFSGNGGFIGTGSDGIFKMTNTAGTDFGRLMFGGTTSSFPAIARNGTALEVVAADFAASGSLHIINARASATIFNRLDVQCSSNYAQIWTESGGGAVQIDLVLGAAATELQRFSGSSAAISWFAATPAVQQASGANLTNNVVASGTTDQIDDFTSLTVYATDAQAIHNDIYQLARKLKQVNDALRAYGLLT